MDWPFGPIVLDMTINMFHAAAAIIVVAKRPANAAVAELGVGDSHAVQDWRQPGHVIRVEHRDQLCPAAVVIICKESARAPKVRGGSTGDGMALGSKLLRHGRDGRASMTMQLPDWDKDKALGTRLAVPACTTGGLIQLDDVSRASYNNDQANIRIIHAATKRGRRDNDGKAGSSRPGVKRLHFELVFCSCGCYGSWLLYFPCPATGASSCLCRLRS
jgi:hypothetical protein